MADEVAIVTGGGRGIGAAVARRLGRDGFAVVVADSGAALDGSGTDPEPAARVAGKIGAEGGTARALPVDVTDPSGVEAIAVAAAELGRAAALVHAAGNLADRSLAKLTPQAWRSVLAVHLDAAFACVRAVWPALKESGRGRVVLVGGAAGLVGAVGQANYATAKAGLLGLMRVLALEGARSGVTANLVLPFAYTRMTESIPPATPRLEAYLRDAHRARPEDAAPLLAWLCSPDGGRVTGQVLGIRGGELLVWSQPRPVARLVAEGGWTRETLDSLAEPPLAAHFTPLEDEFDLFGGPPVPVRSLDDTTGTFP
ncbi:MAG TPA: SDR family NAD(P)-dependent oxidoreductase [Actinomycetes bacterium]|nr:SDR family NAD(P)-dependent oxidoreductase [Actinomycetes bacterium]